MTEGKKKTLPRLGIILVVLTVAVLAMAGTGAAELKDISNVDNFTLTYIAGGGSSVSWDSTTGEYKYSLEGYYPVTKTLTNSQLKDRFGTDRIWTFETAEDINAIAERTKSDDWKHNVTYIQVADIDCSDVAMKSIPGWVYNFNIYGNGYVITNYTQHGEDAHGLIEKTGHITGSVVTVDSVVMRNCWIENINTGRVGAIVGMNEQNILNIRGCKLENSTITSELKNRDTSGNMADHVGGLVGYSEARLSAEAFVKNFIDGLFDWKNLIEPFIKILSGDVSDYFNATFLELDGCSVSQCKIMSYATTGIDFAKYDQCYVGGLIGGASSILNYVNIGCCNVSQTKVGGYGQYVGGISGYGENISFYNLDTYVDNCVIESSNGSAGGLFGCACTISSEDMRSDRDLYLVKNTAVLSGDSYGGVIIGDVSVSYKASIPGTTDNRVHAKNVLVCGKNGILGLDWDPTVHAVSPGYDDTKGTRITSYLTKGVYYNPDTKVSDGVKIDAFSLYTALYNGKDISYYKNGDNYTQKSITRDFILNEHSESTTFTISKVMNGDVEIADLGIYHDEDGYGYFPSHPVTVMFIQRTEYLDCATVDITNADAFTNRKIAEPDPLFIEPEDYSEDRYKFSGWYANEELTDSWDFSKDIIGTDTPRTFYSKLTEIEGTRCYDIEYYDNGTKIDSESQVVCFTPHELKKLDDTDAKTFLGWNTSADGTGTFYEKGDSVYREKTGTLELYAQWKDNIYTVTFESNNTAYGTVSSSRITNVPYGTPVTVNGNTVTIGSCGTVTATPSSALSNFKFDGWTAVPEKVVSDMTVVAGFSKINEDLIIMNDKITFDTLEEGSAVPATATVVLNYTDNTVTVGLDAVRDFAYAYYIEGSEEIVQGLPEVISPNQQVNILIQPLDDTVSTAGEYQDVITLSYPGSNTVEMVVSLSVIEQVEKTEAVIVPGSPDIYVIDYVLNSTGYDYPLVTAGENTEMSIHIDDKEQKAEATFKSSVETKNLTIYIDNIIDNTYNDKYIYLDANDVITVAYPEMKTTNYGGTCTLETEVEAINGPLPTVSGEYVEDVSEIVKAYNKDYNIFGMIRSVNTNTEKIDANLKNVSMTFEYPGDQTIQKAENIKVLHVKGTEVSEVAEKKVLFNELTDEWNIFAESTDGFSSYVVVTTDPLVKDYKRSTVTAFFGENDGNAFTFENAVVITKAVLPGAESVTITNTDGSGWYTCNIDADGFTGNGTVYFQVPLDVIEVKGYTVNDVSFLGETTKYLGSDDRYAKYTSTLDKAGAHTIDFEKGAAATGVVDTPVVTPAENDCKITITGASALKVGEKFNLSAACSCGKVHNYNWTVSDPAVATVTELGVLNGLKVGTVTVTVTDENGHSASKVVTVAAKETQTAAKSPFPVLGILAGLGIAGIVALRRK